MKKIGLLLIGGIAAFVLIAHLGSVVGLLISLVLLYLVIKKFIKSEKVAGKIGWGILGCIVLIAAASNAPAILGFVAAYILYVVYKNWNKSTVKQDDPFTNFEAEWARLKKY